MIFYVSTWRHQYATKLFLHSFGKRLAKRMTVLPYESLFRMKSLPVGTYIFGAYQQLTRDETAEATAVWNTLAEYGHGVRLLNHPALSMRRVELLRHLYEAGINDFDVYRVTDSRRPKRYPVFIRSEVSHSGSLTPLLHDEVELQAAIDKLVASGDSREDKIIVEFTNVADEQGQYHMYTALAVGSRIMPVDYVVDDHWMCKENCSAEPCYVAAVTEYVATNPHEELLRPILEMARIDYGRVDYAVVNGELRIFEINVGPLLIIAEDVGHPVWAPVVQRYASRIVEALEDIDCSEPPRKCIPRTHTREFPSANSRARITMLIHDVLRILRLSKYEGVALSKAISIYRRWFKTRQ